MSMTLPLTAEQFRQLGQRWASNDASLVELGNLELNISSVDEYLNELVEMDAIELVNVLVATLECLPSRAMGIIESFLCDSAAGALGRLVDRDSAYSFFAGAIEVLGRVRRSEPVAVGR